MIVGTLGRAIAFFTLNAREDTPVFKNVIACQISGYNLDATFKLSYAFANLYLFMNLWHARLSHVLRSFACA